MITIEEMMGLRRGQTVSSAMLRIFDDHGETREFLGFVDRKSRDIVFIDSPSESQKADVRAAVLDYFGDVAGKELEASRVEGEDG